LKVKYAFIEQNTDHYPIKLLCRVLMIKQSNDYQWALSTEEASLYLATILDLYARKVVGWSLSERMNKRLVICIFKGILVQKAR
jgi:hypothetical protein